MCLMSIGFKLSPDVSISLLIPRLQKRSKLESVKTVESLFWAINW